MRLQIGDRLRAGAERTLRQVGLRLTLPGQRPGEGDAFGIHGCVPGVGRRMPGPGHGAHAAGSEAAAFLVGPGHDLDRVPRGGAAVADRLHRLQPGEHAPDAVEAAAHGLAVHVAAGQHRRGLRVRALVPQEQVAHRIDRDGQAQLRGPADQQAARLAVQRREAGAVHAVAGNGADPRHSHQPVPVPVLVHCRNQIGGRRVAHRLACSRLGCCPAVLGAAARGIKGRGGTGEGTAPDRRSRSGGTVGGGCPGGRHVRGAPDIHAGEGAPPPRSFARSGHPPLCLALTESIAGGNSSASGPRRKPSSCDGAGDTRGTTQAPAGGRGRHPALAARIADRADGRPGRGGGLHRGAHRPAAEPLRGTHPLQQHVRDHPRRGGIHAAADRGRGLCPAAHAGGAGGCAASPRCPAQQALRAAGGRGADADPPQPGECRAAGPARRDDRTGAGPARPAGLRGEQPGDAPPAGRAERADDPPRRLHAYGGQQPRRRGPGRAARPLRRLHRGTAGHDRRRGGAVAAAGPAEPPDPAHRAGGSADRPAEPARAAGPAGGVAGPAGPAGQWPPAAPGADAAAGPRLLQGRQRHAGPCRGRRDVAGDRRAAARQRAWRRPGEGDGGIHGGAPGRRRVRRAAAAGAEAGGAVGADHAAGPGRQPAAGAGRAHDHARGEHRHRRTRARAGRRGHADAPCRSRALRGQAGGAEHLPLLRGTAAAGGGGAAAAAIRPGDGAARGAVRGALPAAGASGGRADHRSGGAAALAAPPAGPDRAAELHPHRRAERADRAHRQLGASAGLHRCGAMAGGDPPGGEPVAAAVRRWRAADRRGAGPGGLRHPGAAAGAGGHGIPAAG